MKQFSRSKINLACLSALALLTLNANTVFSQEQLSKEVEEDEMEVIQVTGLRGSIFEAVNRKRFSEVISDTIVAEDIGKMPDRNIAEALQRITGISINRQDGEGTEVTIRGIAPNLNLTTINGQTIASAGNGRGIDFSSMPSSMISAIEVYKTPEASQMEGSIGGTINIITARPLDVGEAKGTAFVEAVYTENNEETSPAFSFSYTTPITDTFGIAAAVSHEQINTRTDAISNWSWSESDKGHYPTRWGVQTKGRDLERDSLMVNLQWQPLDNLNIYMDSTYSRVSEKTDLTSFTTWLPSGYADIVDSSVVTDPNTNTVTEFIANSAYVQTGDIGTDSDIDTLTLQLGGELELDNLTISAGIGYSEAETDEIIQSIYNYDHWWWNGDRHDAKFVMGANRQWGYFNPNDADYPEFYDPSVQYNHADENFTDNRGNLNRLVQGSITRAPQQNTDKDTSAHIDFEYALDDNNYISSLEAGLRWNERTKTVLSDKINLGPWGININGESGDYVSLMAAEPLFHDQTAVRWDPVNFLGGKGSAGVPTGWNSIQSFDAAETAMIDWMNDVYGFTDDGVGTYFTDFDSVYETIGQTPDRRGSADNTETTLAAYLQANLYLLDGDLTGNVGVRYVRTDLESHGLTGTSYNARNGGPLNELHYKHDYDNFLPSLNLSYKINDDMVLRFAAATVIARPDFSQATAGGKAQTDGWMELDASEDPDWDLQDEDSYIDGNVYLDPYKANQFDASYEYYFSKTGMFSAGVFYKDISSFIYEDVTLGQTVVDGLETEQFTRTPFYTQEIMACLCSDTPDGQPIDYPLYFESYTKPVNGDGGSIAGLELGFITTLDMIPGMENYGVQANYTLTSSEADFASASNPEVDLPFENQSEHSYNLTGFYEGDKLMVRLAYNWRSESLNAISDSLDGYTVWNDEYGQLDASFSYNFTKNISLVGSVSNLLEESNQTFKSTMSEGNLLKGDAVPTNRNHYQGYNGRTFRLGIRAAF